MYAISCHKNKRGKWVVEARQVHVYIIFEHKKYFKENGTRNDHDKIFQHGKNNILNLFILLQ